MNRKIASPYLLNVSQAEVTDFESLTHRYLVWRKRGIRMSRVSVMVKKILRVLPPTILTDENEARRWFADRTRNYAPSTLRLAMKEVRRFLEWASYRVPINPDLLDEFSPCRGPSPRPPVVYSQTEVDLLSEWFESARERPRAKVWKARHLAGYACLCLHTGVRMAEAAGLRCEDVDFEKNVIRVEAYDDKDIKTDGAWRHVPIGFAVTLMLAMAIDGRRRGRIFPGEWNSTLSSSIEEQAGCRFIPLLARRTFITALYAADIPPRAVCVAVGHASSSTTEKHYWGRKAIEIPGLELDLFRELHRGRHET